MVGMDVSEEVLQENKKAGLMMEFQPGPDIQGECVVGITKGGMAKGLGREHV
jgi:hypothetical protein